MPPSRASPFGPGARRRPERGGLHYLGEATVPILHHHQSYVSTWSWYRDAIDGTYESYLRSGGNLLLRPRANEADRDSGNAPGSAGVDGEKNSLYLRTYRTPSLVIGDLIATALSSIFTRHLLSLREPVGHEMLERISCFISSLESHADALPVWTRAFLPTVLVQVNSQLGDPAVQGEQQ